MLIEGFLKICISLNFLIVYSDNIVSAVSSYNPQPTVDDKIIKRSLIQPNGTGGEDALLGEETANSPLFYPYYGGLVPRRLFRMDTEPTCANGLTYCEEADDYPFDQIQTALEGSSDSINEFFGVEETLPEMASRIDGEDESYLCRSIKSTVYPRMGQTMDSRWKYIVNQENGQYRQGITIEVCANPGAVCESVVGPIGYVTECKQKYTFRKLISLSDDGRPVPDQFVLPAACCCALKRNLEKK